MVTHLAACNIRKAKKLWKLVVIYMVWRSGKEGSSCPGRSKGIAVFGCGFCVV